MHLPIRTSKSAAIGRRSFLRGAGVCLSLPLLECMSPVFAHDKADREPRRMLLISNNLGVLPDPFFPKTAGTDYKLSPYLKELEAFRNDFTVFSGLSHPAVVGGHSTEKCFLTAAKGPTKSGFRNQISLDQFAAESLGQQTRFSTLNLGVNIDKANRSLSWTRDGVLIPAEDSPATLFQKMFVQGTKRDINRRLRELKLRGSILDTVLADTRMISKGMSVADQSRLDQYFTSIRELEHRLHIAGEWEQRHKPSSNREPPKDIADNSQFFDKFQLMLSMAHLALQSDSTRLVTLMVDAFATPVFHVDENTKSINGYHNLSHHGQVPAKVRQLESIDRRQMRLIGELLANLAEHQTRNDRLLDNTAVLYGSNMGDANTHDNKNLPILLAGGGFKHGQHLAFNADDNAPLSNLFVSLLQWLGIETDTFGSSTGRLAGLEYVV